MTTPSASPTNAACPRVARLHATSDDWARAMHRHTFATWLLRVTISTLLIATYFPLAMWLMFAALFTFTLAFPDTAGDGIDRIGDAR